MKFISLIGLFALTFALACANKKKESEGTPAVAVTDDTPPPKAVPAKTANAIVANKDTTKTDKMACNTGELRCADKYAGSLRKGNNPPVGSRIEECVEGKWTKKNACDGEINEGCYEMEDEATGELAARCLNAMGLGE